MQKNKRRKPSTNSEMSSSKFSKFLTDLAVCLQGEKGPEIAYLLKPTGEHGKGLLKDFRNPTVRPDPLWFHLVPYPCAVLVAAKLVLLRRKPREPLGRDRHPIRAGREPLRAKARR